MLLGALLQRCSSRYISQTRSSFSEDAVVGLFDFTLGRLDVQDCTSINSFTWMLKIDVMGLTIISIVFMVCTVMLILLVAFILAIEANTCFYLDDLKFGHPWMVVHTFR